MASSAGGTIVRLSKKFTAHVEKEKPCERENDAGCLREFYAKKSEELKHSRHNRTFWQRNDHKKTNLSKILMSKNSAKLSGGHKRIVISKWNRQNEREMHRKRLQMALQKLRDCFSHYGQIIRQRASQTFWRELQLTKTMHYIWMRNRGHHAALMDLTRGIDDTLKWVWNFILSKHSAKTYVLSARNKGKLIGNVTFGNFYKELATTVNMSHYLLKEAHTMTRRIDSIRVRMVMADTKLSNAGYSLHCRQYVSNKTMWLTNQMHLPIDSLNRYRELKKLNATTYSLLLMTRDMLASVKTLVRTAFLLQKNISVTLQMAGHRRPILNTSSSMRRPTPTQPTHSPHRTPARATLTPHHTPVPPTQTRYPYFNISHSHPRSLVEMASTHSLNMTNLSDHIVRILKPRIAEARFPLFMYHLMSVQSELNQMLFETEEKINNISRLVGFDGSLCDESGDSDRPGSGEVNSDISCDSFNQQLLSTVSELRKNSLMFAKDAKNHSHYVRVQIHQASLRTKEIQTAWATNIHHSKKFIEWKATMKLLESQRDKMNTAMNKIEMDTKVSSLKSERVAQRASRVKVKAANAMRQKEEQLLKVHVGTTPRSVNITKSYTTIKHTVNEIKEKLRQINDTKKGLIMKCEESVAKISRMLSGMETIRKMLISVNDTMDIFLCARINSSSAPLTYGPEDIDSLSIKFRPSADQATLLKIEKNKMLSLTVVANGSHISLFMNDLSAKTSVAEIVLLDNDILWHTLQFTDNMKGRVNVRVDLHKTSYTYTGRIWGWPFISKTYYTGESSVTLASQLSAAQDIFLSHLTINSDLKRLLLYPSSSGVNQASLSPCFTSPPPPPPRPPSLSHTKTLLSCRIVT